MSWIRIYVNRKMLRGSSVRIETQATRSRVLAVHARIDDAGVAAVATPTVRSASTPFDSSIAVHGTYV
jgi:hypothetical protein